MGEEKIIIVKVFDRKARTHSKVTFQKKKRKKKKERK